MVDEPFEQHLPDPALAVVVLAAQPVDDGEPDRQEREEADPDHPPATEQLAERELADDADHPATR